MPSVRRALPIAFVLALSLVAPMAAQAKPAALAKPVAKIAQVDDEVVLPSRVANPIRRTQRALDNAEEHIDENEFQQAIVSLRAVRRNMYRADRAARRQIAAPPPDEEADVEGASPADVAVAVLANDHNVVVTVAGLFDSNSQGVVDALTHALFRTMNARDSLLDVVIAAGAGEEPAVDYTDVMADTLPDYADEVANLTEALQDDALSAGGTRVLNAALAKAQATEAKVTAAFGGGE